MSDDPVLLLTEILEAENAALRSVDLPRAGRMLEAKQRALAAIGQDVPRSREAAERLRRAAEENKRLLQRAIAVQGRVVAIIAQAASRTATRAQYGANGIRSYRGTAAPMAFIARA